MPGRRNEMVSNICGSEAFHYGRGTKIDRDGAALPLPQHAREELRADIHLLTVGLEQSKLRPISDVLGNHKT
ncbi:MAG: hypothetical protein HWN70_01545 [Desulfobacterales bacterium]|nr:hypothetical protein [Desulfobacterales bacterium]